VRRKKRKRRSYPLNYTIKELCLGKVCSEGGGGMAKYREREEWRSSLLIYPKKNKGEIL